MRRKLISFFQIPEQAREVAAGQIHEQAMKVDGSRLPGGESNFSIIFQSISGSPSIRGSYTCTVCIRLNSALITSKI